MIAPYCVAKFGVVGLTKSLAGELAPDEVKVNCVCLVGVSTTGMGKFVIREKSAITSRSPKQVLADIAAAIPLGRNATEDDSVNAILFFLSEKLAFLTGVALDVNGGILSTALWPGTAGQASGKGPQQVSHLDGLREHVHRI